MCIYVYIYIYIFQERHTEVSSLRRTATGKGTLFPCPRRIYTDTHTHLSVSPVAFVQSGISLLCLTRYI